MSYLLLLCGICVTHSLVFCVVFCRYMYMFVLLSFILSALLPFVLYQYYFIFKEDSSISCSTVLVMWDKEDFYTVKERNFMNRDIRGWLTKDNRLFRIFKIYLVFDFWLVGFIVFIANNISVISWRSVLLVEKTGVHREDHRPAASH